MTPPKCRVCEAEHWTWQPHQLKPPPKKAKSHRKGTDPLTGRPRRPPKV